ncbi:hypothetical protein [Nonlabens sp.]|uniref:hypothetical protein n=1 Tax=Nonlabens sp. TaxID=1888209 RepID=UPI001BCEBFE8|nr:hypothetical protein [Nonlabens sp.]
MKNLHHLLLEINQLTTHIKTNYPELYRWLDENPDTLATSSHPNVDDQAMQDYLDSLKQLLQHFVTYKN